MLQNILSKDLEYVAIFSLVLILPKIMQRFKLPSGIMALLIGMVMIKLDPMLIDDRLFRFLSQIGITSLFLFAGLEVDFEELKEDKEYLAKYLFKSLIVLILISLAFVYFFNINLQNSFILALGIFTPSAGFILNSLHSYEMGNDQEYWVRSKAISKEVLSILLLFIALQGNNVQSLITSLVFFGGLFLILPFIFKFYFKFISPYAPNSEIPFLVFLSLSCGVISKELGAYYLVGAFIVGLVGSRFKKKIFKEGEVALFRSLSSFFTVFLPFYFFYAGLGLELSKFTVKSFLIGGLMILVFVPLRIFLINYSLKTFLSSFKFNMYNVSLSLMPTLVFGLVISKVLLQKKVIDESIVFGLIVYTLISSVLPTLFFVFQKGKKN